MSKIKSSAVFGLLVALGLAGCQPGEPSEASVMEAPQINAASDLNEFVSAVKVSHPQPLGGALWTVDGGVWSGEQSPAGEQQADQTVFVVFSYACVHCYNFEPKILAWAKKQTAQGVDVVLLPAAMGGIWDEFARAYFAMQEMGKFELHQELFDQMHAEGGRDVIRQGSAQEIAEFLSRKNPEWSADKILELMRSDRVQERLQHARDYTLAAGVTATPSLVVQGRRRVMLTADPNDTLGAVDKILTEKRKQ